MEASTLQKKKNTISKGKLKKNIKNVICRPDQVFWPEITDDQRLRLEIILNKYRVKIPEFKKLHWKELKLIPKEKRPKSPIIKKVDGLFFGISECSQAIQNRQCSAIIIESTVNPRVIVEPVIEICTDKDIPLLCMRDLRKLTFTNFGIKTSCLGIKDNCLLDVHNELIDISKMYPRPKEMKISKVEEVKMDIDENTETKPDVAVMEILEPPYFYRSNKKTRVFIPSSQESFQKPPNKFIGQDFIEFTDKVEQDSKSYMKMILKRISNNPHRAKKK